MVSRDTGLNLTVIRDEGPKLNQAVIRDEGWKLNQGNG
jgi:hypothetical protein